MARGLKRVLYLTDQGLTAFLVEGRRLVGRCHYPAGPDGVRGFAGDLAQAPELVTRLVLDITEEEFHQEKVPHVFPHDQKKILERRLRLRFGRGRWHRYERQGREREGRRDDLFLVSGITREEVILPWLEPMLEQCVPIDLMVSVPLLVPRLHRMMHVRHEYALFVTHGERGGIRQTFLHRGRIQASRLAPTPDYMERDYVQPILDEVRRMKQFLTSAHLLPFDETLHLYVLGSQEVINLLGREVTDGEGIQLHNYNLEALARRFRLKEARADRHADAFFALLAANLGGLPSYLDAETRLCHRYYQARRLLTAAAVATMVLSVGVMAYRVNEVAAAGQELAGVKAEVRHYRDRQAEMVAARPAGEVSGFLMQDAVEFSRRLERLKVSPFDLYPVVGRALLHHPAVRLRRVENLLADDPDAGQAAEASTRAERLQPARPGEVRLGQPHPVPLLRLHGEVDGNGRSYRQVHDDFTRLLGRLRQSDRFEEVRVDRWPVEIRADRSLVLDESAAGGGRSLRFRITLVGRALL